MGRACWALHLEQPIFSCTYVSRSGTLAVCGSGSEVLFLETTGAAASSQLPSSQQPDKLPPQIRMEDVALGHLRTSGILEQVCGVTFVQAASLSPKRMGSQLLLSVVGSASEAWRCCWPFASCGQAEGRERKDGDQEPAVFGDFPRWQGLSRFRYGMLCVDCQTTAAAIWPILEIFLWVQGMRLCNMAEGMMHLVI